MGVAEAKERQRELYGAPLGELGSQVMTALGITQGRLAQALGLSAPMLSQLMSGRRVTIGDPVIVRRLHTLVDLAAGPSTLTQEQVADRLSAVRADDAT